MPPELRRADFSIAVLPNLLNSLGGLLQGSLMVSLLLGIAKRPNSREVAAVPATPQLRFCNLIRYRLTP